MYPITENGNPKPEILNPKSIWWFLLFDFRMVRGCVWVVGTNCWKMSSCKSQAQKKSNL